MAGTAFKLKLDYIIEEISVNTVMLCLKQVSAIKIYI